MALYLGLMSGTSADGVDAVILEADKKGGFKLLHHYFQAYPTALRQEIIALYQSGNNEIDRLGQLDVGIAQFFAETAHTLLTRAQLESQDIEAIGSHGQTVRHRPRGSTPFTLQIGDPNTIAALTQITTVADFRRRDIALGGQGAPLAPLFHQAAFAQQGTRRAILNLGGIANVTLLNGLELGLGYDIGPANGLLDYWAQKHLHQPFDLNGDWARSGSVHQGLLDQLYQHPFFRLPIPRSTGREEFSAEWLEGQLSAFTDLPPHDVQATLLHLSATSISDAVKQHEADEVFACGGGARNLALMTTLQGLLTHIPLTTTEALGIPIDQVEAATFAWLAHQTLNHQSGNHPKVTGAERFSVLGGVFWS